MTSQQRIKEAQSNFKRYLDEGFIRKEKNETAKQMYLNNTQETML